jgi:hypothetical protein
MSMPRLIEKPAITASRGFRNPHKILAEILASMPEDEQAKIAGDNAARVYKFDVARLTAPD